MTLTVVVPTHAGRGAMVSEILGAVASQQMVEDGNVKVIVVDSAEGAEAIHLEAACRTYRFCRYTRGPRDAASKRNIGARLAGTEWVLFVDSDCLIPDKTLEVYVEFVARCHPTVGAVSGPTVFVGQANLHPWPILENSLKYNQCYDWAQRYSQVGWATTSNFAVRRSVFEMLNGFEKMPLALVGGEDVDFGVRLIESGHRIVTNESAVVNHRRQHIRRLYPVVKALFSYGVADVALQLRYPSSTTRVFRTRARSGLYGKSKHARPGSRTAILAAQLLDLAFSAGVLYAASRVRRLSVAASRFNYVNQSFRRRCDGDLSGIRAESLK